MKVGIDAILLGSWAEVKNRKRILDVGTGCGLIALMCAQRNSDAQVEAIDIDRGSVEEAQENFDDSPWKERLSVRKSDFIEHKGTDYDLIISNPPFFSSGITKIANPRERARHQDILSPKVLIEKGSGMLNPNGRIAMIVPFEQVEELIQISLSNELSLIRLTNVRGRKELPPKRAMMEFVKQVYNSVPFPRSETEITLEHAPGRPTKQFKELCKEFYINF
ncbi:MAG: methyltransferase [Muribaculaceae bacterium]|nr:methyltransferase [Muribaculaceae bacterium]